jgi:Glycosyl transferase family 11
MITCDLIGRLGNQMFQIATTAATAWRNGTNFAFPTQAQGSYTGEVYFPHLPVLQSQCQLPMYYEKGHHYTIIPPLTNAKLSGYWQSEKYFKEYRKEIIDLFNLKPFKKFPNSCFVHIRLGDYIKFKDKHPPVTVEYLDAAMRMIWERKEKKVFFAVMSDDKENAMRMIFKTSFYQHVINKSLVTFSQQNDPKLTLLDMLSMDNAIIANSSFSWWGAWLQENPNQIVIAPKQWFGPGNAHLIDKDIVPENWIKL